MGLRRLPAFFQRGREPDRRLGRYAGGIARLAALIGRFREPIRADLADRGIDLARWWADRRWKALIELIDQLPRTSRYRAALMSDPEIAEEYLKSGTENQDDALWSPPLTEWDTSTELLAEVRDRLGDVIQAVLNSIPVDKGRARPKYGNTPFPRPRTALDELEEQRARFAAQQVLAWFFPTHANN